MCVRECGCERESLQNLEINRQPTHSPFMLQRQKDGRGMEAHAQTHTLARTCSRAHTHTYSHSNTHTETEKGKRTKPRNPLNFDSVTSEDEQVK